MSPTTAFELDLFKRAIEERDASTQLAMYAEDAHIQLTDRINQPRAPRALRGASEIRGWIEDVCARDMTHTVGHTVRDDSGAGFTEACRYPDGRNVLCATVLEIEEGLIVRQTVVQTWDE